MLLNVCLKTSTFYHFFEEGLKLSKIEKLFGIVWYDSSSKPKKIQEVGDLVQNYAKNIYKKTFYSMCLKTPVFYFFL